MANEWMTRPAPRRVTRAVQREWAEASASGRAEGLTFAQWYWRRADRRRASREEMEALARDQRTADRRAVWAKLLAGEPLTLFEGMLVDIEAQMTMWRHRFFYGDPVPERLPFDLSFEVS